nr:MAG TPA: hypothetical protein [Caudoviricetes sp.]
MTLLTVLSNSGHKIAKTRHSIWSVMMHAIIY